MGSPLVIIFSNSSTGDSMIEKKKVGNDLCFTFRHDISPCLQGVSGPFNAPGEAFPSKKKKIPEY